MAALAQGKKADAAWRKATMPFFLFLSQPDFESKCLEESSPAGDDTEHYPHLTNVPEPIDAVSDVSQTRLVKVLAVQGIKL